MRKEYKKELEKIKIKMKQAEEFAIKLPIFEKQIISNKYTGNENYLKFGNSYKKFYTSWGINRGLFSSDSQRTITNYKGDYTEYLWSIYVNCYSLFNNNHKFGLEEVVKETELFFFDKLNSNFYATDEQITDLLENLNDWYIKAMKENKVFLIEEKYKKAQKNLEEAQKNLKELNHD